MSIREIVKRGDPVLGKKCHPVTRFDRRLSLLLDDLRDTLAEANGVGLAAPQIGILRRVCLVSDGASDEVFELINPEILETSGEQYGLEGCLSVPGLWGYVTRPDYVKVRFQDRTGKECVLEGKDLLARCICHETAHLDGHLFSELVDRLYTAKEVDEMMKDEEEDADEDESGPKGMEEEELEFEDISDEELEFEEIDEETDSPADPKGESAE